MIRITEQVAPDGGIGLKIEGRLTGPWIAEARHACEAALQRGRALTLDLAEVRFVDPQAVGLLLELSSRGVVLMNPSVFISEMLREVEQC